VASNALFDVLLTSLIALPRKFSVDLNTETAKEAKDFKGKDIKLIVLLIELLKYHYSCFGFARPSTPTALGEAYSEASTVRLDTRLNRNIRHALGRLTVQNKACPACEVVPHELGLYNLSMAD
jgi:hypothetical protein